LDAVQAAGSGIFAVVARRDDEQDSLFVREVVECARPPVDGAFADEPVGRDANRDDVVIVSAYLLVDQVEQPVHVEVWPLRLLRQDCVVVDQHVGGLRKVLLVEVSIQHRARDGCAVALEACVSGERANSDAADASRPERAAAVDAAVEDGHA